MGRTKSENSKDIQYRLRMDKNTAADLEFIHQKTGMCKAYILRELIHSKANEIRVIDAENSYHDCLRETFGLRRKMPDYGL